MKNVLCNLEALASGIGKQNADISYRFYEISSNQLETKAEREAYRLGALAMMADVAGMKLRAMYYRNKFAKALKRL